jgi:predicted HicB family RNase H-like nuclease
MTDAMIYRGYTASMSFDPEEHIIVGRVEAIDDIITFHAERVKEFEHHFHQVVDDYIAACEQLGGEPEKPASGNLMLRIDPNLHATALKISHRQCLSLKNGPSRP